MTFEHTMNSLSPIPINNVVALHLSMHERIREAAETLRLLPNTDRQILAAGLRSAWPGYVQDWFAYGSEPARAPRLRPTSTAIDRMVETIGWVAWLASQDQSEATILWLASGTGVRTNALARRLRVSRETIRRKKKSAVVRLLARYGERLRASA